MIELSSSWELLGRRKLSDILFIKEIRLDCETYDSNESDLVPADASIEFASKPVVLQPYLHPEVSSVGACCILVRLSTQRLLRIVQLVLISSSPHIDFVDRYGEPLARIEGVLVPNSEEELYRCSSGRLSPHTECVVRFSEITHLDPLVIQHIGVYTTCPLTSPLTSHSEPPSESHTQEIVKLSSFLNTTSTTTPVRPSPVNLRRSAHAFLPHSISSSQLHLSRSTITTSIDSTPPSTATATTNTTEEPQRGKSASSPAAIISGEVEFEGCGRETPLYVLCGQFLTSMYGNQQTVDFWQKCATSLFTCLVQLSLGDESTDRKQQSFLHHMRSIFEAATRENPPQRKTKSEEPDHRESQTPAGSVSAMTNSTFASRSGEPTPFNSCTLTESLNELQRTMTSQMNEILKRLSNLENGRSEAEDLQQLT